MKKVSKKIFMIFFLFFGFVAITNAESKKWIEYDWSIKQGLSSNWLYYDHTIEDTDGYVTTSVDDYGSGVLRKISKDGKKVIWEEYDYNAVFLTVALDDSYYYTVLYDISNDNYGDIYFYRYDKETGEVDEGVFLETSDREIYDAEIYVHEDKIYVACEGKLLDEDYGLSRFYTINSNDIKLEVEKSEDYEDVSSEMIEKLTYNRDTLLTYEWEELFSDEDYEIFVSSQFISDNAYYLVGDATNEDETYGFIMKTDLDKNVIWVKKSDEGLHYFDVDGSSSEYVVVSAYKDNVSNGSHRNPDNVESYIYVYDKDGNILETHDIAKEIGVERADITNLTSCDNAILVQVFAYDEDDEFSSYLVRYLPSYSIKTKVNGNGKIDVINKAYSGENVTYTIIPEDNYLLDKVRITDVNGNVIEIRDNVFTMPSTDVIIEANFLIKNPETNVFLSSIFFIIIIMSIVLFVCTKKYKKERFYRN